MFGRRRLSALEARVDGLKAQIVRLEDAVTKLATLTDSAELERMRASVLNALRSYRRSLTAQETPGDTNGGRARVEVPPLNPPGPRRNY